MAPSNLTVDIANEFDREPSSSSMQSSTIEPERQDISSNENTTCSINDPMPHVIIIDVKTIPRQIPDILDGRKFKYSLPIDPNDGDRATGFRLLSFARPHMRAFWAANIGNRAAIFMWFCAVPLYSEIAASLNLSQSQIWTSSMWAIAGALVSRLLMGLICDRYGGRVPLAGLIIFASIPTALQGAVYTVEQFYAARFFAGTAGGSFVASTVWLNSMFKKDLAAGMHGFSNGLGMAITACQIFITFMALPALTHLFKSVEIAWRVCFCIISLGSLVTGFALLFLADDTPRGNYSELKNNGEVKPLSHWQNITTSTTQLSVWILCIQHACNLGVELVIYNVLAIFLMEEYGLSKVMASLVAAIFPICNQTVRVKGGRFIDRVFTHNGMKGVLQCQLMFLLTAGVFFLIYAGVDHFWTSMGLLCVLAIFIFLSQSATFGIVPYINTASNGVVSGIVGAAGTFGGIIISYIFKELPTRDAFHTTGILLILSSFLTIFLVIPEYGGLLINEGEDIVEKPQQAWKLRALETTLTESSCSDYSNAGSDDDFEPDNQCAV